MWEERELRERISTTWPSRLEPAVTQEALVKKLPTPIPNVVGHDLAQVLELPVDMSVGEDSRNNKFELLKEKRDRFLKEVNDYEIKKKKLKSPC